MGYNRRPPRNRATRRRLDKSYRQRPEPQRGSNRTLFLILALFVLALVAVLALSLYSVR